MPQEPLRIEEVAGSGDGVQILNSSARPLVLNNIFQFQSLVRSDKSRSLVLDFTSVPFGDSARIGALVAAYVKRQKDGRNLALVGVNQRIRQALQVTRVENFFRFYGTLAALNKRIENWILHYSLSVLSALSGS